MTDFTKNLHFNLGRKKIIKIGILLSTVILIISFILFLRSLRTINSPKDEAQLINYAISPAVTQSIPDSKLLLNDGYHIFQSFNNCGPAALSMALKFYEINVSQEELGQALRPYQIPSGDNDDKSVTLDEVAEKSKEYNLIPYLRPMGNDEMLKQFIANGMPVITRTWTKPDEDIGHFRIIKGYDNTKGVFIQDDSLQGKNLEYTYADFNEIWKKFNYEYLILVPKDKQQIAERILGEDLDTNVAWKKAISNSQKELTLNPDDIDARFNLSVAFYKRGEYQNSVSEYEKVADKLSFRTLWYQTEPLLAYFELGNDVKVLQITEIILNNQNRAFSELYILRGKIYQRQGNNTAAKQEYEKAILYNKHLPEARILYSAI